MRTGAIACVVILSVVVSTAQRESPSHADWDWLSDVRVAALDQLMPMQVRDNQLVAYRSYRDLYHDVPERYFTITWPGAVDSEHLTASLVKPEGRSIQQQLLDLHMKRRNAPLRSLLRDVTVRRTIVDSRRCPAVRTRADALSRLSLAMPDRHTIVLHPTVHWLIVDVGGTRIDARIVDNDDPIVRWAIEAAREIEACAAG